MRLVISTILFLITHSLFAQKMPHSNYTTWWKKIDSLVTEKGLYKSALQEVQLLYKKAKTEQQAGHQVKALLYQIQLQETLVDENEGVALSLLQKEIAAEKGVTRALLQVLLADYYKKQYDHHRWNLYDRTATTDAVSSDITTWAATDFHRAISQAYSAAIQEPALKEEGKRALFEPLIKKGNQRAYRSSLYELVNQKALSYFKEDPVELRQEADQSYWSNKQLWEPVDAFLQHPLPAADSTDPSYISLRLLRELLIYYRDKKQTEKLADTDLDRYQFLQNKAQFADKDAVYLHSMEAFNKRHAGTAAADMATYYLATWYKDEQSDLVKAVQVASALAASSKKTNGALQCFNLVQEIKSPQVSLQTERVNLPGEAFRALVEWKNLSKIYLRLIKFDSKKHTQLIERSNYFDSSNWKKLTDEAGLRKWEQALPSTSDYKSHRAEIKIDALPIGSYFLLISDDPSFAMGKANLGVVRLQISAISFINSEKDYFVLHRNTGQPLSKAKIQLLQRKYDYQTRTYSRSKIDELTANDKGHFYVSKVGKEPHGSFILDITHGDDYLRIEEQEYIYGYNRNEKAVSKEEFERKHARVYYFTDRSIYRPGQTIFFKGLLTSKDQESQQPILLTGKKNTVYLYNANGEQVDSLEVTSNEYGSFAGKFTLPTTGLTGQFYLQDDAYESTVYFKVEEYKRPRFEVSLDKLTTTVRLGDTVTIKGTATAYAGNAISNASGTYRITRRGRFMYPWKLSYYGYRPRIRTTEIAHGTIVTGSDGSFNISFPALPDESIDRKTDPVFDYDISIDITDLNGETRSASSSVPVSYKSLQLSIDQPGKKINTTDFTALSVSSTNLAGVHQTTELRIQVLPLTSPGRLIRERYWSQPDLFVLTEKEFMAAFPSDLYKNENDPETWPVGKAVWEKTVRTDSSGKVGFGKQKWAAGWYQLLATAIDPGGDTVTAKSIVFLQDPSGKNVTNAGYITGTASGSTLQPGQQASIDLATEAGKLFVIEKRINWKNQASDLVLPFSQKFRLFELNKERVQIPVIATEADKGGIQVQHVFVRHNRVYTTDQYFAVPLEEKDLKIKLETFRDKLEPGLAEKWTVSVSGTEAEKFGMELLTSMYDASLDQFQPHNWSKPTIWPVLQRVSNWTGRTNFALAGASTHQSDIPQKSIDWIEPDQLIGFESVPLRRYRARNMDMMRAAAPGAAPQVLGETEILMDAKIGTIKQSGVKDEGIVEGGFVDAANFSLPQIVVAPTEDNAAPPAIRTNFNETAFFFPQLTADSNGHFSFSFTMPESVTTWKWQLFAHTKSLAMGYLQQSIITQKDLMVQPNMPRFLREGDKMEITTKVVNLTDKEFTGQAELQLIDATTNQPIDGWFRNFFPNQYFTVAGKSSELVKFPVEVPFQFDRALTWKIIARVGDKTDGESATMPVLSNRQLVTEAIPFFINGATSKQLPLNKLINSKDSETLSNQSLTVEFSANPAWYAIQSLPYLTDYPYECAEQSFNRLYGYLIADHLLRSAPRIKTVLQQWQQKDTTALLSNLQKNEQLKQVLLEETPWVLEAKSEAEQKKRLLLLFDAVHLKQEREKMIAKLVELQSPNGGFSWFKGGPDDRFITQYILTGIGHLQKLGVLRGDFGLFAPIVPKAVAYADQRMLEDYQKRDKNQKAPIHLNYAAVQYHYMRSFFSSRGLSGEYVVAANHYRKEIQTLWIQGNLMAKAMTALALHRTGDKLTATNILKSLQQTAINTEDKGMYWKANTAGYYWQEAPIETQALLIELFQELKQPATTINAMKAWLLLNKQTNRWSSTKATADACYALLLQGDNWLDTQPRVRVSLGDVTTVTATQEEAGTGYYQKIIPGTAVHPEMGKIKIEVDQPAKASTPVWGAVYWQYFDNLENITAAKGPLSIAKQVMIEKLTDKGPVLETIKEGTPIKVGDKITVRLEIKTDRQMEYVHVKDMRASSLEPTNVLSGYRWKGSLGYYESTRDASTNFFIHYLPKGTHIMEYSLFVTHAGTFSNGISSIQCMYAPEFTSHTDGIKLMIEAN